MFGVALSQVAVAVGLLAEGGSPQTLGIALAAFSVPQLVFVLVGGVWSDRLPRHYLMIASDAVRFGTQTTFGIILLCGGGPIWGYVTLQVLSGTASALFLPASMALTADSVPAGLRQDANALLALTRNATNTVAPVVAGLVVVLLSPGWALVIDGATYLASLVLLTRIQVHPQGVVQDRASFVSEFRAGLRVVLRTTWVWTTIVYFMLFNICFATFLVLGPAAITTGAAGALRWGTIVATFGAGQVVGNILALSVQPRRPLLVSRIVMLAAAPMLWALATTDSLYILCPLAVVFGVSISFPDVLWHSTLQNHIDTGSLARVSSFDYFGSFLLLPIGLSVAGLLGSSAGVSVTLVGAAMLMLLSTLASLAVPSLWSLGPTPNAGDVPAIGLKPSVDAQEM